MIISASRRTDIPALYGEWFIRQYKKGIFYIKNPFNQSQIRIVNLKEDNVKCIVFWTKNAKPFLKKLKQIDTPFYFLYTITNYGKILESNVPEIAESITTFKNLSLKIGNENVIWRYDPIIFTENLNESWHFKNFEFLAKNLKNYTKKCIASFIYMYKKCIKNLNTLDIQNKSEKKLKYFIQTLEEISNKYGIETNWCCINKNLLNKNSIKSSCINKNIIEKLTDSKLSPLKDKNQRQQCNCYPSVDIGVYNTCINGCKYCYANINFDLAYKNYKKHNPNYNFII